VVVGLPANKHAPVESIAGNRNRLQPLETATSRAIAIIKIRPTGSGRDCDRALVAAVWFIRRFAASIVSVK